MNFLVAVDPRQYFSANDSVIKNKALMRAVDLSQLEGAELTIVSINEKISGVEGMPQFIKLNDELLEMACKVSEKAKEYAVKKGVIAKFVIMSDESAANSIIKYATDYNVELIVLGSSGKNTVEKFFLGSVAARVVRHAQCSVLVVR